MADLYPSTLNETQEQANELTAVREDVQFKTKLNFLIAHNGLRKNKMHFLIAPTHSGKSTLVRTILRDLIFNNQDKKILLWLTEETVLQFKESFYEGIPAGPHLKNVRISSQVGVKGKTADELRAEIQEMIVHWDIDILICDNITTSATLYQDISFGGASETITWLKGLCEFTTVFCIAHTNSAEFNNRMLTEMDIRGGKSAINLTEFLYIMQPIYVKDTLLQFILIKKHRGQKVQCKFFKLNYDPTIMAFSDDRPVDFESLKAVFNERDKL